MARMMRGGRALRRELRSLTARSNYGAFCSLSVEGFYTIRWIVRASDEVLAGSSLGKWIIVSARDVTRVPSSDSRSAS